MLRPRLSAPFSPAAPLKIGPLCRGVKRCCSGARFGLPDPPGHCACSDGLETRSALLHLSAAPKSGPPGTGLKAPVPLGSGASGWGWGGRARAHSKAVLLLLAGRWAPSTEPSANPGAEGSQQDRLRQGITPLPSARAPPAQARQRCGCLSRGHPPSVPPGWYMNTSASGPSRHPTRDE